MSEKMTQKTSAEGIYKELTGIEWRMGESKYLDVSGDGVGPGQLEDASVMVVDVARRTAYFLL